MRSGHQYWDFYIRVKAENLTDLGEVGAPLFSQPTRCLASISPFSRSHQGVSNGAGGSGHLWGLGAAGSTLRVLAHGSLWVLGEWVEVGAEL